MPLTLLEASKLVSGDVKRAAIIEMFPRSSDLLAALPFIDVPGGAYVYNREGSLPGVAFRGFNESYTPTTGVINPESEILRIVGGELDVDTAIIKTRGNVRSAHEAMQVKAKALYIADKLINGDSEADPREFDGLRKRITGKQLFSANGSSNSAGTSGALKLETLDEAIDAVDSQPTLSCPRLFAVSCPRLLVRARVARSPTRLTALAVRSRSTTICRSSLLT